VSLTDEIDALRKLSAGPPTVEPNSQQWKGLDGAVAFQLIERHADTWADVNLMMREWLDANRNEFICARCHLRAYQGESEPRDF
jgi:hypothetical protein